VGTFRVRKDNGMTSVSWQHIGGETARTQQRGDQVCTGVDAFVARRHARLRAEPGQLVHPTIHVFADIAVDTARVHDPSLPVPTASATLLIRCHRRPLSGPYPAHAGKSWTNLLGDRRRSATYTSNCSRYSSRPCQTLMWPPCSSSTRVTPSALKKARLWLATSNAPV